MSELVDKLTDGNHEVEASLRPEKTLEIFRECLDRAYIHIKFTGTRGGTELGVRIDKEATDLTAADLEQGRGAAHIAGDLTLDYVKVRCIADIDLATFKGSGRLERV